MDPFSAVYDHCSSFEGVTEGFPFGEDVLVFKVMGKIFALMNVNERPVRVNLKCEPELAVVLRAETDAIQPGYHMNKVHWNTVWVDGRLEWRRVAEMIDHSYWRVATGLKKKEKNALAAISDRAKKRFENGKDH